MLLLGIDIGGTKCAAILGRYSGDMPEALERFALATQESGTPEAILAKLAAAAEEMLARVQGEPLCGIGISCGGPLDSKRGVILSPPNLPGWDGVEVTKYFESALGAPAMLLNDADACALAEWKYGAAKGTETAAFLTFGTGLGAGLIIDGRLHSGILDAAGEIGHIRLAPYGPVGFNKAGSAEGFCSGGGIAKLGVAHAKALFAVGASCAYCESEQALDGVSAKTIADAAKAGDADAIAIYAESGKRLGEAVSILIDLINPEAVVIGSIYARDEALLRPYMLEVIAREALAPSAGICRILPSALGDRIGDIAALSIAAMAAENSESDPTAVLFRNYPELEPCRAEFEKAAELLHETAAHDGLILVCGNGGSAADSEHIVGELMKSFKIKRPLSTDERAAFAGSPEIADGLEGAIRAISLPSQCAVLSAFGNDADPSLAYAQLTYGYGRAGDLLIALSTSGNSKNAVLAVKAAKARGMKTLAFTGERDSELSRLCDCTLRAPSRETFRIQEYHLPLYHALCARLEAELFGK